MQAVPQSRTWGHPHRRQRRRTTPSAPSWPLQGGGRQRKEGGAGDEARGGWRSVRAAEQRAAGSPDARRGAGSVPGRSSRPLRPEVAPRRWWGPGPRFLAPVQPWDSAHANFATSRHRHHPASPPRTGLAPMAAGSTSAAGPAAASAASAAVLVVLRFHFRVLGRSLLGRRHCLRALLRFGQSVVVHRRVSNRQSTKQADSVVDR